MAQAARGKDMEKLAPLDPSLYVVDPEVARLLKMYTGITDDDELKQHILNVQKEAYDARPYMYLRHFTFIRFWVANLPLYDEVISLGKSRENPILLDIGSGLGNDVRKIVYDGYPSHNIIATDIAPELWDCGHHLFRSDSQSFPVKFLPVDIFDEGALSSGAVPSPTPRPDLRTLNTLTPLKGHVSVIIIQAIFHLFDRERQTILAQRVATLLSPTPGSIIIGRQAGDTNTQDLFFRGASHFRHSPSTWKDMWSMVFPAGTVEYHTELVDIPQNMIAAMEGNFSAKQWLKWCIKRV